MLDQIKAVRLDLHARELARWPPFVAWVGVVLAFSLAWLVPGTTYDFVYDWLSARAFIDGINPYQTIDRLTDIYGLTNEMQSIHPRTPGALMILGPIGLLPFSLEYIFGRVLTVSSAIGLAWIFARIGRLPVSTVLALLPLLLLMPPFSRVLLRSQTDFLIAALIGATLLLVSRGDRFFAGIPLGLAVTLKLWAWPLGLALLLGRRWRAGVGVAMTLMFLNLMGLAVPHVSFEGTLEALDSAWIAHGARTGSVSAVLGVSPILLPGLLLILMGVWGAARRERPWDVLYIYSIPLALIAAPIVWLTYTISLLIPVAWLLARRLRPYSSREVEQSAGQPAEESQTANPRK